ncbi:MAG TPA: DUF2807 domain-containing protein [Eudoraea sp.]|nr:DUF2807 domain-containing protein [Eudoraea sp.]
MKYVFLTAIVLISTCSFSQKAKDLDPFEALDSNIGATINIMKASEHKITISGDPDSISHIIWEVDDKNLKIRSDRGNINYEDVIITAFTPSISALSLKDGGIATVDEHFSRVESFTASAKNGATVDLTHIEFKNLVAHSSFGGQVVYKSGGKIGGRAEDEDKVKGVP